MRNSNVSANKIDSDASCIGRVENIVGIANAAKIIVYERVKETKRYRLDYCQIDLGHYACRVGHERC